MDKRISVLVIEDEANNRKALKYNLEKDSFEVYLAADGKAGLAIARKEKLQLILLDWMMPEMDGLEVLAKLKSDTRTEQIPVFMLTGKNMMDNLSQAFNAGAVDYITKPFDPEQLGQRIAGMLEVLVKS